MKVIKRNFEKEDCKHFDRIQSRGCCGRTFTGGVCTIALPEENGNRVNKTCMTSMPYCKYEKKKEE